MKIGILTYHRTHNYGGCLQALATRIVLEQMGHKVYYVDYWPKYHSDVYSGFSMEKLRRAKGLKNKIHMILDTLRYGRFRRKREKNFAHFIDREIAPLCKPLSESYDAVIYGSDQIWRKQPVLNDYNPMYFADNDINAQTHIAFSASMGIMPVGDESKKKLQDLISNFNHIAVREIELKNYLNQLGFDNVALTLDPTLLVPKKLWNRILPLKPFEGGRYALLYALHDTFDKEKIEQFASARDLSVKVLYGNPYQDDSEDVITTAGPCGFISLIKNAEFVFSSSFHGLAFSLIYEKEFLVSFGSNAGRAISLLNSVGLDNRFLHPKADLPEDMEPINYSIVNNKLQTLQDHSLNFLKVALK